MNVKYITLVNVLLEREAVPEFPETNKRDAMKLKRHG